MKRTQEFPAHIKPVRSGVYETRRSSIHPTSYALFSWFDAEKVRWSLDSHTISRATELRGIVSPNQNRPWVGLLRNHKNEA